VKIEIFTPVSYYGPVDIHTWPTAPRCYDPALGMDSIRKGLEQCAAAHEAGFDSLNFAEHHYSAAQLSPDPVTYAGILGQQLPEATISVLGTDLPLHNPVRVAESYAMLDNVLGGRLRSIGLLRGTPNEYLTYRTNPWTSREAFAEAVELVIRAMTEPEPFGWEGRHYRYRNISIWPRPVQRPHPRILLSGNSAASARLAAALRCDIGFSFMSPDKCAENAAVYRAAAALAGWEPGPDNILYRHFVYLAATDEEARQHVEAHGWPGRGNLMTSRNPEMAGVMTTIAAAMAGVPAGAVPAGAVPAGAVPAGDSGRAGAPSMAPPIVGGPQTVLRQIGRVREIIGAGRMEIIMIGSERLPHEMVVASLKLMGETLVPALHADTFAL
jgi:alkanesulfonate monooxygenase SsuD/methylene tetrahydromethanopterin reductase-like flavin-dependent oxidoreductase (luciferase family)